MSAAQVTLKITPLEFDILRESLDAAIETWGQLLDNAKDESLSTSHGADSYEDALKLYGAKIQRAQALKRALA